MRAGQVPSGHGLTTPAAVPVAAPEATGYRWALAKAQAYLALTKPRVIELLLVATIPAMLQADRGSVHIGLILATLFGGWLGAASANALNCVVDADIDGVMKRTERRPLARHAVPTSHALIFGLVLGVASFAWLWIFANLLSAVLVVITIAFYVFVYTMVLKRRTWQNVIWGGAAGCMPALVGWSAITGSLSWQPFVLFLIVFMWTPPHTWALAMRYKEDYRAAGVPMFPVIASEERVTKHILGYTWATVIASLLIAPAAGLVYAVVAVTAGLWFATTATQLYRSVRGGAAVKPLKLFLQSNNYLAVLFVGLSVDAVLGMSSLAQLVG